MHPYIYEKPSKRHDIGYSDFLELLKVNSASNIFISILDASTMSNIYITCYSDRYRKNMHPIILILLIDILKTKA